MQNERSEWVERHLGRLYCLERPKQLLEDERDLVHLTMKNGLGDGKRISVMGYLQSLTSGKIDLNAALEEKVELQEYLTLTREKNTEIYQYQCKHCGMEIFAVFDDLAPAPYPYFGNQAKRQRTYSYSPVISLARELMMLANGYPKCLSLANSHGFVHCNPSTFNRSLKNERTVRNLCDDCFRHTYKRELVDGVGPDGVRRLFSLSVMEEWDEGLEYVVDLCGIKPGWVDLGPGSVREY